MAIGNEKKIAAWGRRQARLILFALVLTVVFAGWRLWVLYPEIHSLNLQVRMTASTGGVAQIYYDAGEGLSEDASTKLAVAADDRFREYRFRLPREAIHFLRFDPLMSGGTVSMKDMAVVDALGQTILSVDLRWVQPGQQIQSLHVVDGVLIAVMERDGADPQLAVTLPEPLRPEQRSFVSLLYLGGRVLIEAAVFFMLAAIFLSALQWFLRRDGAGNRFGRVPAALILSLLAIGVIEGIRHERLPAKTFYHEVDELLYRLDGERFDAEGVILGNSVAYQVFSHPSFLERKHVAMLATNEAIGMTGQYFIMKRYLEKNRLPGVVILLTLPLLEGRLADEKADNYLCRTFTRPREILDVFLLKQDPVFALKGVTYLVCPSFKYRLLLQKSWLGFTNAPIYTGAAHAVGRSAQSGTFAVTQIFQDVISCSDIPRRHFVKLLDLFKAKSIPLHFVTPPLKEGNRRIQFQYLHAFVNDFPALQKNYPLLYWSDKITCYPDHLVGDDVHFSKEGLPLARSYLYGLVDEIMRTGGGAKIHKTP